MPGQCLLCRCAAPVRLFTQSLAARRLSVCHDWTFCGASAFNLYMHKNEACFQCWDIVLMLPSSSTLATASSCSGGAAGAHGQRHQTWRFRQQRLPASWSHRRGHLECAPALLPARHTLHTALTEEEDVGLDAGLSLGRGGVGRDGAVPRVNVDLGGRGHNHVAGGCREAEGVRSAKVCGQESRQQAAHAAHHTTPWGAWRHGRHASHWRLQAGRLQRWRCRCRW